MKLGFKAETTHHSSTIKKTLRAGIIASMLVLALATAPLAVAQTQPQTPPPNGSSQPTATDAMNLLTQAVGGNTQTANQLVQALGGDPVTALNAFINGNASSSLAGALGGGNAVNVLTQAMGAGNALSALTGALGQNGSLNALVGALGGSNAIGSLAGSIIGNSGAISALQSALGGNTAGLQALSSFLGGNSGALGALTSALGGTNGALSALTGALGVNGALSSLTGALGANGALSALTGALGVNGALNALTGALGGQLSELLGGLGLSSLCGVAPLTGTFATEACNKTADNRSIEYAQTEKGGETVKDKVEELHTDRLKPALQGATAQLSAGTLDETRQQGSIVDGAQTADTKNQIENEELDSRQGLQQHEQSCALPTSGPALAQTKRAGAALQRAMTRDFLRRSSPVPGTTAARGYSAVIAERYNDYCRYFVDPEDNNGINACDLSMQQNVGAPTGTTTGNTTTNTTGNTTGNTSGNTTGNTTTDGDESATLASRPNGDIDIEGVLLKDTIDIDDFATRESIEALLDNLVQPKTYPKIPEQSLKTAAGKEWTVKKERIETIRKLAADTISSVVSRRIGIPLPQLVTSGGIMNTAQGGPPGQCNVPAEAGDKNAKALAFANYYRQNPNTGTDFYSGGQTYCQRFSYAASGGVRTEPTIARARAAVFGGASTSASPSPTQGGGNAGSALGAWNRFRDMQLTQPYNEDTIKPGDILYFVKQRFLNQVMQAGSRCERDCEWGHTGVYVGAGQICHVFNRNPRSIACTSVRYLTHEVSHRYAVLGFVRPSGVSAQVQDCTFDYNNGQQPGGTTTVASGPLVGATTGAPADATPPSRATPTTTTPTTPPSGSVPRGDYNGYLSALGQRESGNRYGITNRQGYAGRWQMGGEALTSVGCCTSLSGYACGRWKSCFGFNPRSTQDFLNTPALQDAAILRYNQLQWGYIGSRAQQKLCSSPYGILLTHSGMLGGAHLVGAGNLQKYANSGYVKRDGNGTPITHYIQLLGGYTVPFGQGNYRSGNCPGDMLSIFGPPGTASGSDVDVGSGYSDYTTPAPPRTVREIIHDIRQTAGVPEDEIAHDPSYNEIMLAMTKERFFDPRYFSDILNNVPAMQNNETSLNAYISMSLKDIEMIQEQINALVAARASLRIDELDRSQGK